MKKNSKLVDGIPSPEGDKTPVLALNYLILKRIPLTRSQPDSVPRWSPRLPELLG